MKYVEQIAMRVRRNEPLPPMWGGLLRAASLAQRLGMWIRLHRRSVRVPAYVISFGNLTAGGTGKTPAVIDRAVRERDAGKQVAVLTRGYGSAPSRAPLVMNTSTPPPNTVEMFGDEAALIAGRVPGIWIVRSADRVAGAYAALESGCTTLILDDGYQAVRLERDEDILLIDATNPFGNGFLIPRGILREPVCSLRRASEILVTRCDQAEAPLPALEARLRQHSPNVPIRYCVHRPTHLRRLLDGTEHPLTLISGARVRAVCGIGNPEAFLDTLKGAGAEKVDLDALPDHSPIPQKRLEGDQMVLVTEKDAIRIGCCSLPNVYALCISLAPYPFISSASISK